MKFVDSVKIQIRAGNGGAGCTSFRREKHVPRGGPDGGDGGHGGNIVFVGSVQKNTLLDLSFKQHQHAKNGTAGSGKNRQGKQGKDCRIPVPLGTLIKDEESGAVLLEVLEAKDYLFLKGGRGGFGNTHFKSSLNRVPEFHQPGEEGQELWVRLELKLMADVGLVGFPNAGKSTFISTISQAHPKIADYPFTTLVPHLGVVQTAHFETFVVADIPGIIQGAHNGTGLGDRFLKHIERTAILALLLDASGFAEHPPLEEYHILLKELQMYSPALLEKPRVVLLTKIDAVSHPKDLETLKAEIEAQNEAVFPISSATRKNLEPALQFLAKSVRHHRAPSLPSQENPHDP